MAPILEGAALRKAWLVQHAAGAAPAAQEGPQSPAGVQVLVLDGSCSRRVAYEEAPEPSGRHEPCMLSGRIGPLHALWHVVYSQYDGYLMFTSGRQRCHLWFVDQVPLTQSRYAFGHADSLPDCMDTGQPQEAGRSGSKAEGWLYESPKHAAEAGGSGPPSREGSVEDGELPRAPVQFSLSAGKAGAPQHAQPSTADAQKPPSAPDKGIAAALPGKQSLFPSGRDRSVHLAACSAYRHRSEQVQLCGAAACSSEALNSGRGSMGSQENHRVCTGSAAASQHGAPAEGNGSFLPPHLLGMVSPQPTAPSPSAGKPAQQTPSAAAASKPAEKQPPVQSSAGQPAKMPAAAPSKPEAGKQPASSAAQQSRPAAYLAPKQTQGRTQAPPAQNAAPAKPAQNAGGQASSAAGLAKANAARQAAQPASRAAAAHHEAARHGAARKAPAAPAAPAAPRNPLASAGARGPVAGRGRGGSVLASSRPASTGAAAGTAPARPPAPTASLAKSAAVASQTPPTGAAARAASSGASKAAGGQKQPLAPASAPAGDAQAVAQAGSKSLLPGSSAPPASASAPASQPPVSAEAVAQAQSFLDGLGSLGSPGPGFSWGFPGANAPHGGLPFPPGMTFGGRLLSSGQMGSSGEKPRPAAPQASRASIVSPEMRLESLMQELSDMKHKLPAGASAKPQQGPAARGKIASRSGTPSGTAQQRPTSRSASPGGGMPAKGAQASKPHQAAGKSASAGSAGAKQTAAAMNGQQKAAMELQRQIAELQREIELKQLVKQKKAAAKGTAEARIPSDQASKSPPFAAGSKQPGSTSAARSGAAPKAAAETRVASDRALKAAPAAASSKQPSSTPAAPGAAAPQKQQSMTPSVGTSAPAQSAAAPAGKAAAPSQKQPVDAAKRAASDTAPAPVKPPVPAARELQVQSSPPTARPSTEGTAEKQPTGNATQQAANSAEAGKRPEPQSSAGSRTAQPTSTAALPKPHVATAPLEAAKPAKEFHTASASAAPAAQSSVALGPAAKKHMPSVKPSAPSQQRQPASTPAENSAAPGGPQPGRPEAKKSRDKPQASQVQSQGSEEPIQVKSVARIGASGAVAAPVKAAPSVGASSNAEPGKLQSPEPSAAMESPPAPKAVQGQTLAAPASDPKSSKAPATPASTAGPGSAAAAGHIPALPLPVLTSDDSKAASMHSSGGTPHYTMLTRTPLGTGSAWPVIAAQSSTSGSSCHSSPSRRASQPTSMPDSLSVPTSSKTRALGNDGSVPGPQRAGQRASPTGQLQPLRVSPLGVKSPLPGAKSSSSAQRPARGRVVT